jgi:hypothetical protein
MQTSHKYECVICSNNPKVDGTTVQIQVGQKHHYKFYYVEPVQEDADVSEKFWHERFLVQMVVRDTGGDVA